MDFGNLIKSKRKELGLTQIELSEGICTQALISRIEKGDIIPQDSILQQLGTRLQLDDKELNSLAYKTKYDNEMIEVKKEIRRALTRRDYEYIEKILEQNKLLINVYPSNIEEFREFKNEKVKSKYIDLLNKELKVLNNSSLESKAQKLYQLRLNYPDNKICKRCFDFKELESLAQKY